MTPTASDLEKARKYARALCETMSGPPAYLNDDDLTNVTIDGQFNMLEAVAEVFAALIASSRPEWQPIATAPKDGSYILVYGDRYSAGKEIAPPVGISRWIKKETEHWDQVSKTQKRLRIEDDSHWDYDYGIFAPTHWQPLPIPPQVT